MPKFEKPVVEIEKFEVSDVITASNECPEYCDGYIPCPREF